MHFCYCAGINSQSFAGAGGRECSTDVAGAGGNGQKFSGSGMKKIVPRRAVLRVTCMRLPQWPPGLMIWLISSHSSLFTGTFSLTQL